MLSALLWAYSPPQYTNDELIEIRFTDGEDKAGTRCMPSVTSSVGLQWEREHEKNSIKKS